MKRLLPETLTESVAFAPDGKYVLSGSFDRTARLWDSQTGQELRQFTGHTDQVIGVAFSPGSTVISFSMKLSSSAGV